MRWFKREEHQIVNDAERTVRTEGLWTKCGNQLSPADQHLIFTRYPELKTRASIHHLAQSPETRDPRRSVSSALVL